MRRIIAGLVFLALAPLPTLAQPVDSLRLRDLQTPTAPGFVLLDVAPTAIARPQTPRALALNLLSATDQDNLIPQNYALEVAPYWLVPHPTLSYEAYYAAGVGRSVVQTLSLSLATLPLDAAEPEAGTRVGVGVRTMPFAGDGRALRRQIDPLLRRLTDLQDAQLILLDDADAAGVPPDSAALQALRAEARDVALRIQEADTERAGFLLEIAGAAVWAFPRNDFEEATLERLGAWITPTFRLPEPLLDVMGVARLFREDAGLDTGTLLDLGGRLRWELPPLALSAEAVGRLVLSTPQVQIGDTIRRNLHEDTHRFTATLEYDVSEDMQLFASFGRNHEQPGSRGTLIALIGINYGFGRRFFVRP